MIANFFNKTKPVVFFIVSLMLFLYYIVALFQFKFEVFSFFWLLHKIGVFLLFVAFLLIASFIIRKNTLTQNNSYAILLMAVLLGTFYEAMFANDIIISTILLLLGFRKIYSLKSGLKTKLKLYDASFWFGVAALVYCWSILYVVLIYVTLIIYHRITIKNFIIPLIGLATPIFIYFTYCFYFDNLEQFYNCWLFRSNFKYYNYNDFRLLIPIAVTLATVIWSILVLTPKVSVSGINVRRAWRVVLNHLIISAIIIAFSPKKDGSEMLFMVFPVSVVVTNFLRVSTSENFKNLILYLFLLISISVYFL
ncbi:hypothetical protein SAMN06265371_105220 [Lutibacter agarilyticus]|uniref:Beta-carotene 15,15'-monooxygenase n=1 Tax=Lutibacter agarilyticus TaxID=1109740 RepID=A0A238XCF1_9FLAO|nr:DUF6427 family protein [Lutibacter agarilyticus]SNR56716.1 hypothetical protein SAMN06265371_105220 [Lutibacter agarilyticus]